ncbi:KH domain-containing, RNA-binding, signal transduction-associated protein 3 isoform X1, partial [Tachysurus ichikawai]
DYNDEIRQAQLQELTFLNGGSEDAKVPAVRGKSSSRARGTPAPGSHRSRGGVPPPHAVVPRGAAPRGAPPSRIPSNRGRAQRGRGAPPPVGYRPPPPVVQDSYGEYVSKLSLFTPHVLLMICFVFILHTGEGLNEARSKT